MYNLSLITNDIDPVGIICILLSVGSIIMAVSAFWKLIKLSIEYDEMNKTNEEIEKKRHEEWMKRFKEGKIDE